MLKFKRVSKEWISKNAESLLVINYDQITDQLSESTYPDIADNCGMIWRNEALFLPHSALHSPNGVDKYGGSWVWIEKENPECLYLLDCAPKHPCEVDETPTDDKVGAVVYYTYEPDYAIVGERSVLFPAVRIVDDSMPEGEFKTLAESGMLFTDMKKLGEHFEVYSRTYVYHPWVQSAADFRLNQKSE